MFVILYEINLEIEIYPDIEREKEMSSSLAIAVEMSKLSHVIKMLMSRATATKICKKLPVRRGSLYMAAKKMRERTIEISGSPSIFLREEADTVQ